MIVVVAAAIGIVALAVVVVMVVMMVVLMLLLYLLQCGLEGRGLLHRSNELCAVQDRPRRRDDGCALVMLAQQRDGGGQLVLGDIVGVAEHDATRALNLIVEELTEVAHIQLALARVDDDGRAVERSRAVLGHVLDRADDVGQLAHARRLDEDAVGGEVGQHLMQCLAEIADERAADAALIHLGDLHAALLEKARIDADLTELVLDQHDLFAAIRLGEQLFDQRGLTRAEKS